MTDFENIYDALKAAVNAMGKAKKVGPRLRPESKDAAGWLLNCLNPNHEQKLDPEQVALILRMACDVGYHDAKAYFDRECGYAPSAPLALEAQLADALRAAQANRRRAEESERDLRDLIDNPRLLATLRAAHVNTEAMS